MWFAAPFVEGDDLHVRFRGLSPARRRTAVATFGRSLATVHGTLRFERPGPIDVVDGGLAATAATTPATNAADPGWGPPSTTDGAWLSAYGRAHVDRLPAPFDPLRRRLAEPLASASTTADPDCSRGTSARATHSSPTGT